VWTPDRIIDAAQQWAAAHGRPPRSKDWRRAAPENPAYPTVIELFGRWNVMMVAAGFEAKRSGTVVPWTREQALQALFEWRFAHGRLPRYEDWRCSSPHRPGAWQMQILFGSWNAAIVAGGYAPRVPRKTVLGYQRQAGYHQRVLDGKPLAPKAAA
jgi:hypothetical protein